MDQSGDNHAQQTEAERLLRRLDKMVAAGRVTDEEAERVRAAADSGERDEAVREIRLRHARARVGAEVRDGRVTQDEADLILRRLENGEHPRLLRGLRRRKSSAVPVAPPASESGNPDEVVANTAETHTTDPAVPITPTITTRTSRMGTTSP